MGQQTDANINNRPTTIPLIKPGETLSAKVQNRPIKALNELFSGLGGARNLTNLKASPTLFIATEAKSEWTSGGTAANTLIKVRPIRMSLYAETGTNDDVIGDEIEIPKFWNQAIEIDDIGIGVNMGAGQLSFYAIKGGGVGSTDDVIFEGYNEICGNALQADTWKRGDPDTDNPDNPDTTAPVEGFLLDVVSRVCYDSSTGILSEIYREHTIDSLGMLKEMSEEKQRTIIDFTCI